MTEDQNRSIRSWTELRDELLQDNATLQTTKDGLLSDTESLGQLKAELQKDVHKMQGALEVYEDVEKERSFLVSQDLAVISQKKAEAELVLASLLKDIEVLSETKNSLNTDISNLLPVHERVTFQIAALAETVQTVVQVNQDNIKDVNIMISNLREVLQANKNI